MEPEFPLPCEVTPAQFQDLGPLPSLVIKTDDDVERWRITRSYHDYDLFLRRLNESVVGVVLPWNPGAASQPVTRTLELLDTLESWIQDIPPQNTPQRFGNIAFRTWGARLAERADELLEQLLPPTYKTLVPYIKPYLLASFGSFTRMDYGTGHEACFALFLLCLTLVRFFQPTQEEERQLVLSIFVRYLRLCWKLQDTYKLEPAGSHGVWGLDDYSFLPYIFGSGQLRDQTDVPPSAILHPPLPATNLYFMAIMRIQDVKRGPFFEHSSQLYNIATGVPNWGKVNSGLFKMYQAEVLGKRVVVQHIPLGGLLEWEEPTSGSAITTAIPQSSQPSQSRHLMAPAGGTPVDHTVPTSRPTHPVARSWNIPLSKARQTALPQVSTDLEPPPVGYIRETFGGRAVKRDNTDKE